MFTVNGYGHVDPSESSSKERTDFESYPKGRYSRTSTSGWRRKHSSTLNRGGKKQKTAADASPSAAALALVAGNVDGGQSSGTAQERPPGKKREKQMLQQRASMEAIEYFVAKKKEADAEKDLKKEERCKKAFAL
ncbi:hypothetical protein PR202_ga09859 [Eleusine coracana subsp. coracana]|uniref:No apical meristem-associated C-terminal domain-containing protein n=1 Tax=Eleusine coracana subsp. coracana TaxID=191504 RepID=A0AAV5C3Y6_ELECO|nr:hypothetical protein PR202_ga09859 [Eleusine coracana subsp. coracana]